MTGKELLGQLKKRGALQFEEPMARPAKTPAVESSSTSRYSRKLFDLLEGRCDREEIPLKIRLVDFRDTAYSIANAARDERIVTLGYNVGIMYGTSDESERKQAEESVASLTKELTARTTPENIQRAYQTLARKAERFFGFTGKVVSPLHTS